MCTASELVCSHQITALIYFAALQPEYHKLNGIKSLEAASLILRIGATIPSPASMKLPPAVQEVQGQAILAEVKFFLNQARGQVVCTKLSA